MSAELHFSRECGAWVGRADDPKVSAFVRRVLVGGFAWGARRPELGYDGHRAGYAHQLDDAIGLATDAWRELEARALP